MSLQRVTPAADAMIPGDAAPYDIAIVGGGMAGLALAAALRFTPWRVLILEAGSPLTDGSGGEGRAMAWGSIDMLKTLGAWPWIEGAGAIREIWVSDAGWSWVTHLAAAHIQQPHFGFVVRNRLMQWACQQLIEGCASIERLYHTRVIGINNDTNPVQLTCERQGSQFPVQARLVVAADGAFSQMRELLQIPYHRDPYTQACVVSCIHTERPHQGIAHERFRPAGPLAILPSEHPDWVWVVWTVPLAKQEQVLSWSDAEYLAAIAPEFGDQLGSLKAVTPRKSYVPRRLNCRRYGQGRTVLIGDAAHTTHPLGGQGLNLGFRDVMALANLLQHPERFDGDPGHPSLIQSYQRQRQGDVARVLFATHFTNLLFANRLWPLQWGRRLGLMLVEWLAPLKKLVMVQGMGMAPEHPRLSLRDPSISSNLIRPR
ncbi:MAG: UbiH/UbiF/VisC/COQ6 family ubiquinone biosynthesis hydroxylase [Synechococcales cyanobacterium]